MIYIPLRSKKMIFLKKKSLMRLMWVQRGLEQVHLGLGIPTY